VNEAKLARQIIQIVIERAEREGARRVVAVHGWIAETEAISVSSLAMHFAGHAQGTVAEGASLDFRLKHVKAQCRRCATRYAPARHVFLCPACGGGEADLLGNTGMGVDSIDVG
jgi:hydrogenase nickel incorporation protein HypA/HybF